MNVIKANSLEITKDRLGRNIWILLHSSAAALKTNEEVKTFKTMWESMVKIFPCPECKGHLVKMLLDPNLSNKYNESNTPQDINKSTSVLIFKDFSISFLVLFVIVFSKGWVVVWGYLFGLFFLCRWPIIPL